MGCAVVSDPHANSEAPSATMHQSTVPRVPAVLGRRGLMADVYDHTEMLDHVLHRMSLEAVLAELAVMPQDQRDLILHAAQGTHEPADRREAVARNVRVHRLRGGLRRQVLSALVPAGLVNFARRAWKAAPRSITSVAATFPLLMGLAPLVGQEVRPDLAPSPLVVEYPNTQPGGVRLADLRVAGGTQSCRQLCPGRDQRSALQLARPHGQPGVSVSRPTPIGAVSISARPSERPGRALVCWHDVVLHPDELCVNEPDPPRLPKQQRLAASAAS